MTINKNYTLEQINNLLDNRDELIKLKKEQEYAKQLSYVQKNWEDFKTKWIEIADAQRTLHRINKQYSDDIYYFVKGGTYYSSHLSNDDFRVYWSGGRYDYITTPYNRIEPYELEIIYKSMVAFYDYRYEEIYDDVQEKLEFEFNKYIDNQDL